MTFAAPYFVLREQVEQSWYWVEPDYALPHTHEAYPIREAAVRLNGAPCVFHFDYPYAIPLTKEWQEYIAKLMAWSRYRKIWTPPTLRLNFLRGLPAVRAFVLKTVYSLNRGALGEVYLTPEERERVERCFGGTLHARVAFANGTGFGKEPKANWVTMEDLTAELPRLDKVRTCGTNCHQGIETVDHRGRPCLDVYAFIWEDGPPAYVDLSDPRIVWATVIRPVGVAGGGVAVNKFPRLDGGDVPLPLIRRRSLPLLYELWYLEKCPHRRPLYNPPTGTPWVD